MLMPLKIKGGAVWHCICSNSRQQLYQQYNSFILLYNKRLNFHILVTVGTNSQRTERNIYDKNTSANL